MAVYRIWDDGLDEGLRAMPGQDIKSEYLVFVSCYDYGQRAIAKLGPCQ